MSNELTNISPIDGRYQSKVSELGDYFSEMALMKYRILVEVKYLIALGDEEKIKEVKGFSSDVKKQLNQLWQNFSIKDAQRVKEIEKITDHDVKSVEYFIKENIENLKFNKEFIHFALTSEDVNNLAYTLQMKDAVEQVYLPAVKGLLGEIEKMAMENKGLAMLAMTHGQPATPTTLGKELAVFCFRLNSYVDKLCKIKFLQRNFNINAQEGHSVSSGTPSVQCAKLNLYGKLNGASGCFAAHNIAYPDVDWIKFSKNFVEGLGLAQNQTVSGLGFNPLTTQIESHDSLVDCFDVVRHINNILIDMDRDFWLYISRGVFKQKLKKGEVGSSTMPHKVNPINFENSEGNLQTANALLNFLSNKLPISRMQRDLTDSTVLRNCGVAFSHSLLGVKSLLKGLGKLEVNRDVIKKELDENPEVLAEAVQTILRKVGFPNPYEKLKEMTRGRRVDLEGIRDFINGLDIDEGEKEKLLNLGVEDYVGLAGELVERFV